jgi:hypothetical protein
LIGIEYIVSERIFKSLPEDEKPLWHSHRHETTSGELVMPGIPNLVEHTAIGTLVSTYGKTWHTWQIDRDSALPIGTQLMMGFTADGQLKLEMIQSRDKELGISTATERQNREDLAKSAPPVQPGADGWSSGQSQQLTLTRMPLKNKLGQPQATVSCPALRCRRRFCTFASSTERGSIVRATSVAIVTARSLPLAVR